MLRVLVVALSGVVTALALAACRRADTTPSGAAGAGPSATAALSATAAVSAPSASVAAPASNAPAKKAQAEALLERWRAAQNAADFAAYEALYAQKFLGIKRVGLQSFRFDRKRWLLDRKGMFVHEPEVGVQNVSVIDTGKTAVVRFEQTFASKSFRDVGTKLLVFVEEGGELKIGREEMLSSLLAAPAGVVGFPDFAFIVHHAGKPFALLEARELEPDAALEYVDLDAALAPLRNESALPEARRGLGGRTLALYGAGGEVCKSKVTRVVTLARAIAHFGQRQEWAGQHGSPPAPKPEVARALADLARGASGNGSYLALELQPSPACAKARWARDAERPAPTLFTRRPATPAEAQAATTAFERLPVHAANQKRFQEEQQSGSWYRFDGSSPAVRTFEAGGSRWVSLSAQAGHGCGSFMGEGWALFEDKNGALGLASHEPHHRALFIPEAAFDADGDGQPEILGEDLKLVQRRDGQHRIVLDKNPPDFDCGC